MHLPFNLSACAVDFFSFLAAFAFSLRETNVCFADTPILCCFLNVCSKPISSHEECAIR